jgi:hypothetical protein
MKIVSSPAIVPTTSGQRALSMASAHRFELAGPEPVLGFGHDVAVLGLDHAQLAQVAAHARLGGVVALTAQQLDELGLATDGTAPQDAHDGVPAQRLGIEFCGHRRRPGTSE